LTRFGVPEEPTERSLPVDFWQMLEGAAIASVVLPFIQAMLSKAGEDTYAALCRLFRRNNGKQHSSGPLVIVDPETNTMLILSRGYIPPQALFLLAHMHGRMIRGCTLVWSYTTSKWRVFLKPEH